jgi:hypothetical protein
MKRKLLVAGFWYFIIFFSINASAQQMFAGYDQFCGVPVVVIANPQSASAARDQIGNPVIYVDPSVMQNWSTSRMFALAHECGHHKLGHSTPQGMWFRNTQAWATRQQELDADCWAAQKLAQIQDVQDLRRMILQFASQGPMPQGPYPSGRERAMAVAQCSGISIGYPSGYGLKGCGCWGPNPPPTALESRCESGYVRVNVCPGFCAPGQPVYAYVCM